MKKLLIIYIVFVSFLFQKSELFSQADVFATVYLKDIIKVSDNVLDFELVLYRNSDTWTKWANGTFEFTFDSTGYSVRPDSLNIELIPQTTELDISPSTGSLPKTSYYISPRIFNGRISITVIGPEDYSDAKAVGLDTPGVKIGKFRLTQKSGQIPSRMIWLEPTYYYQACAFKMANDSLILPSVYINYTHDNIEMDNSLIPKVNYKSDYIKADTTEILDFRAEYAGQKQVRLLWKTKSERFVKGWKVARAIRDYDRIIDSTKLNYADTIVDYTRPYPPHSLMTGLGSRTPGRDYVFEFDTVPYRGIDYCYELQYVDEYGNLHPKLAYACLPVPYAVIFAADNNPNPFSSETKISFTVDDDVVMNAYVYDLQGKLVETLFTNITFKKGTYKNYYTWMTKSIAQQGVYDIVLIAYPINDQSIELSKAIIKASLVR